jgi:hypothetical protein
VTVTRLLLKLPWFISTPAIVALAAAVALGMNMALSDYFERTFLDEADPLAGIAQAADTSPSATAGASTVDSTPAVPTPAPDEPAAAPGVLAQGTFRDGDPGHNGEGSAKIIRAPDGSLVLRFEEFSVTNGPDLFVILSTDPEGSRGSARDGLDLGGLRATDGNINYAIPSGVDVSQYRSAIIYCRQFNVVFAVATLEVA